MSQRREKTIRRNIRRDYQDKLTCWKRWEPPRWRFISHWLWQKEKPAPPKAVRRCE